MALTLNLNGSTRSFEGLAEGATLAEVVAALGLKADRVAIERNGEIVARSTWGTQAMASGDKVELVHFVGGGSASAEPPPTHVS